MYNYDEIVHWKPNLFQVSSGSSGKPFMLELSHLYIYQEHTDCLILVSISLKACSILVALILQKLNKISKNRDHVAYLNCRLSLWKEGSISALLDEAGIFRDILVSVVLRLRIELHEFSITRCYRVSFILPCIFYLITHL